METSTNSFSLSPNHKPRDHRFSESVTTFTEDPATPYQEMPIQGNLTDVDLSANPPESRMYFPWLRGLFAKYDNSVLILLIVTYFLQGFKIFLFLSVKDMFKHYLNLEPNYSQFLFSLMTIPWTCKILYGLISDNIPIMGSKRKSYVIINGAL